MLAHDMPRHGKVIEAKLNKPRCWSIEQCVLERQLRLQHAAQWGTGDSPIRIPTTFDGFIAISDLFI